MLGRVYKNYNERVKVITKTNKGYKCKKWFNGTVAEVELRVNQLNSMKYICTI